MSVAHDINCGYHIDQYSFECDCGATRPRHPDFRPYVPGDQCADTDGVFLYYDWPTTAEF